MSIDQRDKKLHPQLQDAGCNCLCHVKILEMAMGIEFSVDDVNDAFKNRGKSGLSKNAGVLKPDKLASFLLNKKGITGKLLTQIGANGNTWGGAPIDKCHGTIARFKTGYAPHYSHYVLTDLKGKKIIYDPMGGALNLDKVEHVYHYVVG